jgi:hypothetical protein
MGKYLDMLKRLDVKADDGEKSELREQRFTNPSSNEVSRNRSGDLIRLSRFFRPLDELERRCPEYVEPGRWHQAVEDGRRFLAHWGEQADALGWTARDLFGLHEPPSIPHPTYQRLARYDCTGLIWLLQGCPVVALTQATAAVKMPTGTITTYRKHKCAASDALHEKEDA